MKCKSLLVLAVFPILLSSCGGSETDKRINEFKDIFGAFQTALLNRDNLVFKVENNLYRYVGDERSSEPYSSFYDEMYLFKAREVEQEQFYAYDSEFKRTIYVDLSDEGVQTTYDLNAETNKYQVDSSEYKYYPVNNGAGVCTPYKYGRGFVEKVTNDQPNSRYANFEYNDGKFSLFFYDTYDVSGEYADGKFKSLTIGLKNVGVYYEAIFTDISYNVTSVPEKYNYEIVR